MAPVRAAVADVVLVLTFLAGLWVGLGASRPPPAADTALRASEQPGPDTVVTTGGISYRVLGWRCGILAVQGYHADWLADGQEMQIQDQPTRTEARPGAVQEFDVWFDVPPEARPEAVQLYGEEDPDGARIALGAQ